MDGCPKCGQGAWSPGSHLPPPPNPVRYLRDRDGTEHLLETCLRCGFRWRRPRERPTGTGPVGQVGARPTGAIGPVGFDPPLFEAVAVVLGAIVAIGIIVGTVARSLYLWWTGQ